MRWARSAVVIGALLLLGGFAVGSEVAPTVVVAGTTYRCAPVVPLDWPATDPAAAQACATPERTARVALWSVLGVGGLLVAGGLTVLAERRGLTPVPA